MYFYFKRYLHQYILVLMDTDCVVLTQNVLHFVVTPHLTASEPFQFI